MLRKWVKWMTGHLGWKRDTSPLLQGNGSWTSWIQLVTLTLYMHIYSRVKKGWAMKVGGWPGCHGNSTWSEVIQMTHFTAQCPPPPYWFDCKTPPRSDCDPSWTLWSHRYLTLSHHLCQFSSFFLHCQRVVLYSVITYSFLCYCLLFVFIFTLSRFLCLSILCTFNEPRFLAMLLSCSVVLFCLTSVTVCCLGAERAPSRPLPPVAVTRGALGLCFIVLILKK